MYLFVSASVSACTCVWAYVFLCVSVCILYGVFLCVYVFLLEFVLLTQYKSEERVLTTFLNRNKSVFIFLLK